jgi:predicted dehydrogenase
MSTERRLATAVLGTGQMAPVHIAAVRRTGLADVVALAGSDPDRTDRLAREWDIPQARPVAQVLADEEIDVVHIVGTNDVHAGFAIGAIEAGKQVVVEKPIALTGADAVAIVEAAARRGVHGMTTFTYWGVPAVQALRARVHDGVVGKVHLVHGSYLQDWMAAPNQYDWRCDPRRGGASRALADIGSHWFSLVEFVTGSRIESVAASFGRAHEERTDGEGWHRVANEDTAVVLFRLIDGGHGAVVASQVSHGHGNHLSVEVTGPRGTVAWEAEDPALVRHPRPADVALAGSDAHARHASGLDFDAALGALVDAFYHDVASRSAAPGITYPTLEDGARSVAVVDAALRSMTDGGWSTVAQISPEETTPEVART